MPDRSSLRSGFFLFEFFIYSFPPLGSVDLGPCALLGYNASMP
jgi:hypothetical protein